MPIEFRGNVRGLANGGITAASLRRSGFFAFRGLPGRSISRKGRSARTRAENGNAAQAGRAERASDIKASPWDTSA